MYLGHEKSVLRVRQLHKQTEAGRRGGGGGDSEGEGKGGGGAHGHCLRVAMTILYLRYESDTTTKRADFVYAV